MHTGMKALGSLVWVTVISGCGPGKGDTTEGTAGTETTGNMSAPLTSSDPGDGTASTSGAPTSGESTSAEPTSGGPSDNREVDILFVIDNSGSMGEEQARLASNIAAFVSVLDGYQASYRIGVTTTDSGNPRCPSATYKPEGGNLVLSSCVDRIDQNEFKFGEDDFSFACIDRCNKRDSDLTVLPTAVDDGSEAPRRWVEFIGGQSNIAGASVTEALQCYLPQGVAGCGFEQHLESTYLALAASGDKSSKNNYGFMRETAQLAVIIVSDEADCSYNPDESLIFTSNKQFWSDPNLPAPTSAVCWNAGVECTGGPGTYSECHAQNYDVSGSVTASDDAAVLQSVTKYTNFIKDLEAAKQQISPGRRVKVSLIAGVPTGYESNASELVYEDSPDSDYQNNYGIAPGCVLDAGNAVPPVREREFAEAFAAPGQRNLYSICQNDYSAALTAIAEDIRDGV